MTSTSPAIPLPALSTERPDGDPGWPGLPPWTRGARAGGPWRIVQAVSEPEPALAADRAREELAHGADGLLLEVDAGAGGQGIGLLRGLDLASLLLSLPLEGRTLCLDAGDDALAAAAALPWAQGQPLPAGLQLQLGADPVGRLLRCGRLPGGTRSLGAIGDLGAFTARVLPGARALAVDLRPLHEMGAAPAELLAVGLATGLTYLRALVDAGLTEAQALGQLVFRVPVSTELLSGVAELRALRRLWGRLGEACGAAEAAGAVIHAFPARRGLTQRDPSGNLLRGTAAVFTAACGGADLVTTLPADGLMGPGSALGRRQARNCQLILRDEASLGRVMDPAGGSYFFETWTEALCQAAWGRFQEIEAQGGVLPALERGLLMPGVQASRAALVSAVASRRRPITGVSEFAWLDAPAPAAAAAPPPGQEAPMALVAEPLPAPGRGELLAAMAGADPLLALRGLSALVEVEAGEIRAEVLPPLRLAAPFEAMRDRSDVDLRRDGQRPAVTVALLGRPAEHGPRLAFVRNLLAAGGLEARAGEGSALAQAGLAGVVVLCGTDAAYADEGEPLVRSLCAAGARQVWLAGRPGTLEPALRAAGLTGALFVGCDVLAALERIWSATEAGS